MTNRVHIEPGPEDGKRRIRHFIGTLTTTGDHYLVPASRRMDWNTYDIAAEQSHDPGPLPSWAVPIRELEHVEFENPQEVM